MLKGNRIMGWLLAWAVVLCLLPAVASAAPAARKKHAVRRSPVHHSRRYSRRRSRYTRWASSRYRRYRSSRYRHGRRVAHRSRKPGLEISPARAQQIQQALIQDGDLHSLPTGRWDASTREAMKLYQEKNGFQATGLPDAKSLMKMGLGPHPLPAQLDPLAQAGSGVSAPRATGQSGIPPQ